MNKKGKKRRALMRCAEKAAARVTAEEAAGKAAAKEELISVVKATCHAALEMVKTAAKAGEIRLGEKPDFSGNVNGYPFSVTIVAAHTAWCPPIGDERWRNSKYKQVVLYITAAELLTAVMTAFDGRAPSLGPQGDCREIGLYPSDERIIYYASPISDVFPSEGLTP